MPTDNILPIKSLSIKSCQIQVLTVYIHFQHCYVGNNAKVKIGCFYAGRFCPVWFKFQSKAKLASPLYINVSSLPQNTNKLKTVVPTVLSTSVFHHVCCVFRACGNHSHWLFEVRPVLISTVVKTTLTELMLSNTSWAHHDRTRAQTQINIHWLSLTSYSSRSLCVCVCAFLWQMRT